jgi:hypothetical protein
VFAGIAAATALLYEMVEQVLNFGLFQPGIAIMIF